MRPWVRSRHTSCVWLATACCIAIFLSGGCTGGPFSDRHYDDSTLHIQNKIESYLEQQRQVTDGAQRLNEFRTADYQSPEQLTQIRGSGHNTAQGIERALKIIGDGPLTLDQCLYLALELNNQMLARRAEINAIGGEQIVV
jgi:hypothetical protein